MADARKPAAKKTTKAATAKAAKTDAPTVVEAYEPSSMSPPSPEPTVTERQARTAKVLAMLLDKRRDLPAANWNIPVTEPDVLEGCVLLAYDDQRVAAVTAYAQALGTEAVTRRTHQGERRVVAVGEYAGSPVEVWTLLTQSEPKDVRAGRHKRGER